MIIAITFGLDEAGNHCGCGAQGPVTVAMTVTLAMTVTVKIKVIMKFIITFALGLKVTGTMTVKIMGTMKLAVTVTTVVKNCRRAVFLTDLITVEI